MIRPLYSYFVFVQKTLCYFCEALLLLVFLVCFWICYIVSFCRINFITKRRISQIRMIASIEKSPQNCGDKCCALLYIDTCDMLGDEAEHLVTDRIRQTCKIVRRQRLRTEECYAVAKLRLGDIRDVNHALIHADASRNRRTFAAHLHTAARICAQIAVCVAD